MIDQLERAALDNRVREIVLRDGVPLSLLIMQAAEEISRLRIENARLDLLAGNLSNRIAKPMETEPT